MTAFVICPVCAAKASLSRSEAQPKGPDMPSSTKATMLPTLLLAIGAIVVSAAFLLPISELLRAYAQLGGGVVAMIGAVWLMFVQRRQRANKD
jgi:hypothetical protein